MAVRIDTFRPEHAQAFDALNRAWLIAYQLLEPADELHLTDPAEHILAPGGQIFVALEDQAVVGTCAVVPWGPEVFEVAKLAVAPAARGRGIGRQLVNACLAYARRRGARQAVLLSSSRLGTALELYEQVGVRYAPRPASSPYTTADVYMELDSWRACPPPDRRSEGRRDTNPVPARSAGSAATIPARPGPLRAVLWGQSARTPVLFVVTPATPAGWRAAAAGIRAPYEMSGRAAPPCGLQLMPRSPGRLERIWP